MTRYISEVCQIIYAKVVDMALSEGFLVEHAHLNYNKYKSILKMLTKTQHTNTSTCA